MRKIMPSKQENNIIKQLCFWSGKMILERNYAFGVGKK
jgi:hypothetical protein